MAEFNGAALGSILAGTVFAYAGIKGYSVSQSLQNLIHGRSPALQTQVNPIGTPQEVPTATSIPVMATGNSISNDAMKYVGHPYIYGGVPGQDGQAGWDCSSFCNWVLGHDLGMTLPGESQAGYSGADHGPTTLSYLAWSLAQTVGHTSGVAQAGDLCVWQTHMGVCTGNGEMVSALNESLGTQVTSIPGGAPAGELLFVRRIVIGNPHA